MYRTLAREISLGKLTRIGGDNITRQECTYNVTLRRVRESVAVKKQQILLIGLCVSACGYSDAWACACA